jgi:RNA polymerase sigma factor (sigma-70 family)
MKDASPSLRAPAWTGQADDTLEVLLESVARREEAAFRALYDRAAPKLLGIALRILKRRDSAEDVVQDVFVKLWNGQAVFDATLGSGFAFLSTITRNRALDLARRRSERPSEEAAVEEVMDLMPSPETVAADRSELRALLICLEGLAEGPRRAIVSAYVDGLTGEDIAARLSAPVGTVKSWIHRGLAALRECLGR